MKVVLRANWFVGGAMIKRGEPPSVPVEVPDQYRDCLPTGAKIVADDYESPNVKSTAQDVRSLSELARRKGTSMVEHLTRNSKLEKETAQDVKEILSTTTEDAKPEDVPGGKPPFQAIGGGWHEFPDGTRVQGLEKAKARVKNEAPDGAA